MKLLKKILKLAAERIRNRNRYILNEMKYRFRKGGDPRDEFTKLVHKCRYLKSQRIIYNVGDGGC